MCRCALDEASLSVECCDSDEEEEVRFEPSEELKKMQNDMAVQFERQKAKGGIIDLEWEKVKYLVNSVSLLLLLCLKVRNKMKSRV